MHDRRLTGVLAPNQALPYEMINNS